MVEWLAMQEILVPHKDNFTPPERTPWGGRLIVSRYKAALGIAYDQIVGESWEISTHPSFPSRFKEPVESLPFLVKLLNSASNLSVQVHPKKGPTAKTEAWVILDAQPGAGLYLGLQEGVTQQQFELGMASGADLSPLLNFVEVGAGDVFFVPSGTLHAIGGGILLLEVQQPSDVTYRAYDWGRGRPLHLKEVSQATSWGQLRGKALVETLRRGGRDLVNCPEFHLRRLQLGEHKDNTHATGVQGCFVAEGLVEVSIQGRNQRFSQGESFIITPSAGAFELHGAPLALVFQVFSTQAASCCL